MCPDGSEVDDKDLEYGREVRLMPYAWEVLESVLSKLEVTNHVGTNVGPGNSKQVDEKRKEKLYF